MDRPTLVPGIGTVLDRNNAVKEVLIGNLGSLSDAVKRLYELIEKDKSKTPRKAPAKSAKSTKSSKSAKNSSSKESGGKKQKAVAVKSRNAELNGAFYGGSAVMRDLRGEQR